MQFVFFLMVLSTAFLFGAPVLDARPQKLNAFSWIGKQADKGVTLIVDKWMARHAPGKAGNEGEFQLPSGRLSQPMVPVGSSGIINNGQLNGLGQQAFGPSISRMFPNNQFRGQQQPRELGSYQGPALNRGGRW